jgi:mono/diheme cytochrome c family protein
VQAKFVSRLVLISVGIALLLAGLFFDMGTAASSHPQSAMPTPDRLTQPTLPPAPSQADRGAQIYWLSCLPCHGDKGQGLTDEFRTVYPPEDQNCWKSGCHGKRPYENGFTIPTAIPAVIGYDALTKFSDAAKLRAYIRAAMPFWNPGSLTEEEAWSVTAFILRESGLRNATVELNEANAAEVKILPVTPQQAQGQDRGGAGAWLLLVGVVSVPLILFFILKKIQNKATI